MYTSAAPGKQTNTITDANMHTNTNTIINPNTDTNTNTNTNTNTDTNTNAQDQILNREDPIICTPVLHRKPEKNYKIQIQLQIHTTRFSIIGVQ